MAMMEQDTERIVASGTRTVLTFLVGAAAGAVTALLLAPYSGKESREKIKDVAKNARDRVGRIPSAMRDAASSAKEAFGDFVEETSGHRS